MTGARARAAVVAVILGITASCSLLLAPGAEATTYRYWTFWWGDNTPVSHTGWKFASAGPSSTGVREKAVIGWRFATTSAAGTTKPRFSSSYDSICPGGSTMGTGSVDVAIVLDFGASSDWPNGEKPPVSGSVVVRCVAVSGGTAAQAMSAAGIDVRTSSGLVCGIDGFPETECAPVVDSPTTSPTPRPSSTRTASPSSSPRASASSSAEQRTTGAPSAGTSSIASTGASPSATSSSAASGTPTPTASDVVVAAGSSATDDPEQTLPATTAAPAAPAASGSPVASALGVAAVVGLAGVAFWLSRRRT
ncbi:MAG TPA: SCO2322 family protein [Candidatus Nanopelagicales bacterium]|nr:SCO2322 family protein [Candidatus Nanopelagicales bacterium]